LVYRHRALIDKAAGVTMSLAAGGDSVPQSAKAVVGAWAEVVIPLTGLVDIGVETIRLNKEIVKVDKDIAALDHKLANPQFLERAPDEVIAEQRARLTDEQTRRQRLVDALTQLG
jgi:valyl-tRNA synthetase